MALTKVTGTGLGLITGDIATSTAGTSNFRAGVNAGNSIASGGTFNVAVGDEAGTAITTGDQNTFVGYTAGDAITTAGNNTAIGSKALSADTLGSKSVAIGRAALNVQNFTSATDAHNVAVGYNAGSAVTTGLSNTLIGGLCGDSVTTGDDNVSLGYSSLRSNTASNGNVAVGASALYSLNITGDSTYAANTAVGYSSGLYLTTGTESTFIGAQAGQGITGAKLTGNTNTAVGASAGLLLQGAANQNTMVGQLAGHNVTTGSGNVCIGISAETSAVNSTNQIVIGESVTGVGNNNFTFGVGSSDSNIDFGETSITAPSDQRYKEDIATATAGLSFIKDLRPVTFKWKKEKDLPTNHRAYVDGSETRTMNDYTNHGFLAQEVKTVIDAHSEIKNGFSMWKTDEQADGGRQRLGDGALMPMMVKAMQELSAKIDTLQTENTALKARVTTLES